MRKISIKDIANQAGVCIGTVSRVINNLDRVHPETRKKILTILKTTGYRPSSLGRALVSGKTSNVLVVFHDLSDPYCTVLSKNFSKRWHGLNFRMLIGDSDNNPEIERELLVRARDGSVDGLIISPIPGRENRSIYRDIIKSGFPIVTIDNRVEGLKTNCVKYDDYVAASLAIEYLAAKGHRHIAFVHARPEYQTVKDRLRAYQETIQRLNLPLERPWFVPPSSVPGETTEVIRSLINMKPAPTAILAENEMLAMSFINTIIQTGRRIPEDVAVVAIGDAVANQFTPVPLTTVSLKSPLMCQKAVDLLHRIMVDPNSSKSRITEEIIEPNLVIGASA